MSLKAELYRESSDLGDMYGPGRHMALICAVMSAKVMMYPSAFHGDGID